MNLVYGEITDLFAEDGMRVGRVKVAGAIKKVPLDLLTEPERGDTVLLCDGVAISKVRRPRPTEDNDVPRHPR